MAVGCVAYSPHGRAAATCLPVWLLVAAVGLLSRDCDAADSLFEKVTAQILDTPVEMLEGRWSGESRERGERRRFMTLNIRQNPDCSWYADAFIMGSPEGLVQEPCETRVRGGSALLTVRTPDRHRRIIVMASKQGDRVTAAMMENDSSGALNDEQAERGPTVSKFTFELWPVPQPGADAETLAFVGELNLRDEATDEVALVFTRTPELYWIGHIDIPRQGLLGIPLTKVVVAGNVIDATIPTPTPARLTGVIDPAGESWTVEIRQGDRTHEKRFSRAAPFQGPWKRPQTPQPPFGYNIRYVTLDHPAGHRLTGTLTIPNEPGLHLGALLLAGSPAQDRDYLVQGHRLFHVLADRLSAAGIAVLRMDDRGTGGSTGATQKHELTLLDRVSDAIQALDYLRDAPQVDPRRIGLIGHSHGGLVAPLAANIAPPIAWVVLLAAPGTIAAESRTAQMVTQWLRRGLPRELVEREAAAYRLLLDEVVHGADAQSIRDRLLAQIHGQIDAGARYPDADRVRAMVEREVRLLRSPAMRMVLPYDPAPALAALRCPVLALHGSRDEHASLDRELFAVVDAIGRGGRAATITTLSNLNHFFQPTSPAEVSDVTFDERAMASMVEWIVNPPQPIPDIEP